MLQFAVLALTRQFVDPPWLYPAWALHCSMSGMRTRHASKEEALQAPAPAEEGSDDEAPEEVAKSQAEGQAAGQRREEKETRMALEEKRKGKRMAVEERNKEQKSRRQSTADVAGPGTQVDDLLPDAVLAAIQQRRLGAETEAGRHARLTTAALQHASAEAASKRRKVFSAVKGPVTVQVLSKAERHAAATHNNFRREQLMGDGATAKRSHDMLRPAGSARRGPAARFT